MELRRGFGVFHYGTIVLKAFKLEHQLKNRTYERNLVFDITKILIFFNILLHIANHSNFVKFMEIYSGKVLPFASPSTSQWSLKVKKCNPR
uniref:Uncharacterized protein n=1 Tax=Lepeophtheirus salmonis TaxID=72036 RepID=A0A0K2U9P4_LEPSM